MSLPELATVAEGDLPGGQHWILQAGGTREDFYTFLETVHPDGHRDQGGMGARCFTRAVFSIPTAADTIAACSASSSGPTRGWRGSA